MLQALILAAAIAAPAPDAEVVSATRAFLDAYAADQPERVIALTEPDVEVYGSDAAEFCRGQDCLRGMMADDFALWGTARFGTLSKVTTHRGADWATIVFEAPFAAGGGPQVPVRFSLLWRKEAGGWRLAQAANAVPSTGSSAKALLEARGKTK